MSYVTYYIEQEKPKMDGRYAYERLSDTYFTFEEARKVGAIMEQYGCTYRIVRRTYLRDYGQKEEIVYSYEHHNIIEFCM